MIFYDPTHTRKYISRTAVLVLVLIIALAAGFFIIEFHTPTSEVLLSPSVSPTGERQVVLTFDDGPHPIYTREILDVLDAYGVSATFFYLGENMLTYPDIVSETYNRGHLVGSHSYSHSRDVHESPERIRYELFAAGKLIERATGRQSVLYRPPYLLDLDDEPTEIVRPSDSSKAVFHTIEDLGHITVGSHINSNDWNSDTPLEIISSIMAAPRGNIVVFHDAGGDRTLTVETLPVVIAELREAGYDIVPLEEFMGLPRDTLMPPIEGSVVKRAFDFVFLGTITWSIATLIPLILITVLVLSMLRLLFVLVLSAFRRKANNLPDWKKGVSILVPAFNEEKNIEGTIRSIARSTCHPRQIIVVDDGSSDATAQKVQSLMHSLNEDLHIIQIPNSGKSQALNTAIEFSKYEVLLAIDADTVVHPDAFSALARHFHDPTVGAAAGKVVALAHKWPIPYFQDFEYTIGQNIDKQAFDRIASVGIIPGAIGAWRRSSVMRAGGYSDDTLVEDQDLTYAMHALGKRVVYEERGVAYTEVPHTIRGFYKQRLRWIFGGFQCLWKYKSFFLSVDRPTLGWILLPYNLVFMVLTPLVWPLILIFAAFALISGSFIAYLGAIVLFMLIDLLYAAIGLQREKGKWHLLLYVPFQRAFYRVVVTIVIYASFIRAIEGSRSQWNKLERTGSANSFFQEHLGELSWQPQKNVLVNS